MISILLYITGFSPPLVASNASLTISFSSSGIVGKYAFWNKTPHVIADSTYLSSLTVLAMKSWSHAVYIISHAFQL